MIITAPEPINVGPYQECVFLAGSIEQGTAENWQDKVAARLDAEGYNVFNPRRKEWDATWEQRYSNIQFRDQVIWEQNALERADVVIFYFDKNTKSPITLLELGQVLAARKNCVVYCDPEFWRYGNIEVMCHLYGVRLQPCINIMQKLSSKTEEEDSGMN